MSTNLQTVKAWAKDQNQEEVMLDEHVPLWQRMIDCMQEKDLSGKTVLDYGCNRGLFFHQLYSQHPFAKGVGVDVSEASIQEAEKLKKDLPLEFGSISLLNEHTDSFDLAFSHEVIYLLPDLKAHAQQMKSVLKDGGVYYAATGCHVENPLWPLWKDIIEEYYNVPAMDYTLDDYANAFFEEGFEVSARQFALDSFIPLKHKNRSFPTVAGTLHYYTAEKTLFRFQKKS